MKLALSASIVANVALCTALVCLVSFGSKAQLGAPVANRMAVSSFSRAVTPAPTFRSAVANAYCEEVIDPTQNMRYETMSYMPDFGERDMEAQVNYMIGNGLIPCVEFDKEGTTFREHSRMPGYYDGRYWTMWKLPLFGAVDPKQVMYEVVECRKHNPNSYIRILGFDNVKQVQCMGFVAVKPPQRAF
mmetsp:Transcript_10134/g.24948  ORF Transcript_10134/g.24948 Transcript_10134/m.24948 type:complete len:188 (+) Transcript_10134:42-605(+)